MNYADSIGIQSPIMLNRNRALAHSAFYPIPPPNNMNWWFQYNPLSGSLFHSSKTEMASGMSIFTNGILRLA